jgi:hypothetical protein
LGAEAVTVDGYDRAIVPDKWPQVGKQERLRPAGVDERASGLYVAWRGAGFNSRRVHNKINGLRILKTIRKAVEWT